MVLLLSRRYWLVTGVGGMVAGWPISALAAPDAQTLLAQSDRARGSGMPGGGLGGGRGGGGGAAGPVGPCARQRQAWGRFPGPREQREAARRSRGGRGS